MTVKEPIEQARKTEGQSGPPALVLDWDLYGQYLADSDVPEADRRMLIETLWSIIVSFVDLGFRLGPVQDSCGQAGPPVLEANAESPSVLTYEDITATRSFEGAAAAAPATSSQGRPHGS